MRTSRLILVTMFAAGLAACGGGNDHPIDAPDTDAPMVDASGTPECPKLNTPVGTISSYPGTYAGTINGAGANIDVQMGGCAVEAGNQFYEPVGEDVVVKLTGLTVGSKYGVVLTTDEDLSFYVITGCDPTTMAPGTGQCQLFVDETLGNETGSFTASATEEYIVIDTAADPSPPPTGAFSLKVVAAQCEDDTACSGSTPACESFECTECHTSFGCTSTSAPVCDGTHTCVVGPSTCTGDDSHDSGTGDDGPSTATTVTVPTAGNPTVVNAAVCDSPDTEGDWYKLVWPSTGDLGVSLTFTGSTNNLEIGLFDSSGNLVDSGTNPAGANEAFAESGLAAGTYYLLVIQDEPANTTAAVSYTMRLSIPNCATDYDCNTGADPVCGGDRVCAPSPGLCTSDDVGDTTSGGDNGPAGARLLTPTVGSPASSTGAICTDPQSEMDLYKVVVAAGGSLTASLSWTGSDDLDLQINDSTGTMYGLSYWKQPEVVSLTYLPAGTYYIQVTKFDAVNTSPTTTAYTIQASVGTPQVCTGAADCAAEFSTQLYRGSCSAGSCHFIDGGGAVADGAACDSGDDCTSTICSYQYFQSNAQNSVCTEQCTVPDDCTVVGAGLTCSMGSTMICLPDCGADTDCGADPFADASAVSPPWVYNTCTVGTGVCALP